MPIQKIVPIAFYDKTKTKIINIVNTPGESQFSSVNTSYQITVLLYFSLKMYKKKTKLDTAFFVARPHISREYDKLFGKL